jgi:hypothetical protein
MFLFTNDGRMYNNEGSLFVQYEYTKILVIDFVHNSTPQFIA